MINLSVEKDYVGYVLKIAGLSVNGKPPLQALLKGRSVVRSSLLLFSVLTELGITAYLYHCPKPVCFLPIHRWKDFISLDLRVVRASREGWGFGLGLKSSVNRIACSVSVVTCVNSGLVPGMHSSDCLTCGSSSQRVLTLNIYF